jgi:hypothetical protein
MKSPVRIALFMIVFSTLILAACGTAAATRAPSQNKSAAPAATAAADLYSAQAPAPEAQKPASDAGAVNGTAANTLPDTATVQTGSDALTGVQTAHMIIKNAEVKLLVEKTDTAIDRSMQVVGDVGGYIISSKVWYQAGPDGINYKYATISIGVPVDQFETAMRRLRGVALRVLDENASGQDVTNEYVDLQSQLGNLEATRDRIRTFLDNAQTVEESLRINQELTTIEGQIEQVKGRMNFLSNRSAYSTITVNLEPDIPPVIPTATPTAMPTATPEPWNPGKTLHQATDSVTVIYQGLIELAIWFFVVAVPLVAPIMLAVWGIFKFGARKSKKTETNK